LNDLKQKSQEIFIYSNIHLRIVEGEQEF